MSFAKEKIIEILNCLPEEAQDEVVDFVEFLQAKQMKKRASEEKQTLLTFSWEGALKDLKDEYTSVELQHKASDWVAGLDK